jgi:hypothetical protein
MRKFWIGTVFYVTVVSGVIVGACAGFNALVGMPAKDPSQQVLAKMEPIQRTSGKWTPVEINRESANPVAPPVPPYVAPRLTSTATASPPMKPRKIIVADRKPPKKVVIARRGYATGDRQVLASYTAPEPPRFFGPFRFGF